MLSGPAGDIGRFGQLLAALGQAEQGQHLAIAQGGLVGEAHGGIAGFHFAGHGQEAGPPVVEDRRPVGEALRREALALLVVQAGDAGQQGLFRRHPGEGRLVDKHLGEGGAGHRMVAFASQSEGGVDRQLGFGEAVAGPVLGVDGAAGLVVQNQGPAVLQVVDAVDDGLDPDALDLQFGLLLAGGHGEGGAVGFQGQPDGEEPVQAFPFQGPVAGRQFPVAVRFKVGEGGGHGRGDGLVAGGFALGHQGLPIAGGLPEMFQGAVHQGAPGHGVEALDGGVQGLGPQAVLVVGPGRADGLGLEEPGAAGHLLALGHRRGPGIGQVFQG